MADIIISAGHGTHVAGTSGNGMTEVEEARKVSNRVVEILKENGLVAGFYYDDVSTTQNANLTHLVNYHNKQTRKLDVSVHFNSSGTATSSGIGTEVYYKDGDSTTHKMAAAVSAAMALAGGFKNRGAKSKSLAFTNGCKANSLLLEVGFMNSSTDMSLYKQNFENICQAIAYTLAKCVGKTLDFDDWKGEVSQEIADVKLSVNQAEIEGQTPKDVEDSIGNSVAGLVDAYTNSSYKTAPNSEGGFRVTRSGGLVIIDKQPLEETPGEPIYPDLVAPQKTPEEYVQPISPLWKSDNGGKTPGQSYDMANEVNFESFIKKGIDIAKIFFDYEDYQKRSLVYDNKEHRYKTKIPNFGKPSNNNDPFPVDEKIEELEQHLPFMKIHRLSFYKPHEHIVQLAKIVMDLSDKIEKRMVQVENNLATLYRNTFRLGSRVHINCVYYGGQSEFHKYKSIRCLHHDRVNDGQIMTLDQCLNCTRYEPILGKVYEIENELGRSLELINDDNQMAYQQMQDSIEQTKIEEKPDKIEKTFMDLEQIKKKERTDGDKDFKDMWPEGFKMNWDFVPIEKQTPHVRYDDGRESERLDSNYKNIEHHNDPTGAGFEGIGIFYGPTGSTFNSKLGYGGGFSPSGNGGYTGGMETTSIQSTEEVRKQVEMQDAVFNSLATNNEMTKYVNNGKVYAKNVDAALKKLKSDDPNYEEYVKEIASKYGLDPLFVLAIIITESTGDYRKSNSKGTYIGLMGVSPKALPSNYGSMSVGDKMKANLNAGCSHIAGIRKHPLWNTNNIMNLAIGHNAGPYALAAEPAYGYRAVYDPGLRQEDHNIWTYDQIFTNLKRNIIKLKQNLTEKLEYYPKVHYIYMALMSKDVAESLSTVPAAKEIGFAMTFPYPSEYYDKKVTFTSDYGNRDNGSGGTEFHNGVDLQGGNGSPIVAAAKGTVTKVSQGYNYGMGNVIEITHEGGVRTIYMHLQDKSMKVSKGDSVNPGTVIAKEGRTGDVRGPTGFHLHFEIRNAQNKTIDPKVAFPYLKGQLHKKIKV
ncbi:N-acetylmuramoyl-L-alanine amidase [Lysinibacillus pakistanensis]|uniref:N-acetylmuramoyl-L-alanine amidase n=1 Tax=Lysinibacillus pakistanensis TaxID=759811 RepID=UPI003D2CD548